jgi:hypothetical protein
MLSCFKYLGVLLSLMMVMYAPKHVVGIETVLLCAYVCFVSKTRSLTARYKQH